MSRPAIGIVALLLGLMIGNGQNNSSPTSASGTATVTTTATVTAANAAAEKATATVTVTKTNTVTKTVQAAPAQAGATIDDGLWQVGTDIKPGTYKTKVPSDSFGCYYARLKSSDTSAIIANNILDTGSAYVTIQSGDKYFETKGCGTWQKTK